MKRAIVVGWGIIDFLTNNSNSSVELQLPVTLFSLRVLFKLNLQ